MSVENLITNHIDIWIAATQAKSASGRGSNKKHELYGIKKLRELILELAVRGKLVPQDPNDEPASVLLARIAAEKARLVKEGKIKKPKALPEIAEDEKPFALPEGWEVARLGSIVAIIRGITFPASEKYREPSEGKIACLRTANVQDNVEWDDLLYVSRTFVKRSEQSAEIGDIVMSMANSRELVGKVAYISDIPPGEATFGGFLSVIRPYQIDAGFLMAILRAPQTRTILIDSSSQTTNIANISLEKLNPLPVAIPPLEEQHRIVAKVDELMALCDQLEQQTDASIEAHQQLVTVLLDSLINSAAEEFMANRARISDHFDTLFTTEASIDALKQTILQLAVMGKLVPQDPNDEPAAKLLERIAAEKARLVKEKKIKKDKPLPAITEDEKPFPLPKGWEWCRLGSLMPQFQNGASSRGDSNGIPITVLRLADIKDWKISLDDTRTLPIDAKSIGKYKIEKGDILIIRVNGSSDIVGRFISCDEDYDAIYCDHFIRMRFLVEVLGTRFLSLLGSSDIVRTKIADLFVSTTGQKTVNQGHISSILLPLPSIAEQHRIVAKVDELMAICDQLKQRLSDSQQTQLKLTDALVDGALA
ncbi:restriction endonuclease subunit S [Shewanella khirikhana]|uniref:restriction endonuclease subunit S n=1 Tax=Shewanella khirikhana TaxID=1965282 RepID=UPI0030D0A183